MQPAAVSGWIDARGDGGAPRPAPRPVAAEPPPETTRIRLIRITGICVAPQYVADDLLHAEGFTDVEYVPATVGIEAAKALGSGEADITMNFVAPTLMRVDAATRSSCWRGSTSAASSCSGPSGPVDPRPEGEDGRGARAGIQPAHLPRQYGGIRGPRPTQRHQLGRSILGRGDAAPRRGQDRRLPGLSPGPAGTAGEEDRAAWWSTARWTGPGRSISAACGREPGVRPEAPGGHQTGPARDLEGG